MRYRVQLLKEHQTQGRLQTPHFDRYIRAYCESSRRPLELTLEDGRVYKVLHAWRSTVSDMAHALDPVLVDFCHRLGSNAQQLWIGAPDGVWYNGDSWSMMRSRMGRSTSGSNGFRGNAPQELVDLIESFEDNFREARKAWKKEQKASGAEKEAKAKLAQEEAMLQREATRKLVAHIKELQVALEQHLDLIQNRPHEATTADFRVVFDLTNELSSLNSYFKKVHTIY